MAQATPTRRALVDLPINVFGTPSTTSTMRNLATSYKRQIDEVDDAEFAQPKSRICTLEAGSASNIKAESTQKAVCHASSSSGGPLIHSLSRLALRVQHII